MQQLETRQLLSGDAVSALSAGMESHYLDPKTGQVYELHAMPPLPSDLAAGLTTPVAADSSSQTLYPLSSIPALNSLAGARASLYLDFDGDYQASWGAYGAVSTPAYDTDGNASTFSAAELDAIRSIWSYVAEDYAPFNINVTTVAPPSLDDGVAVRLVIGGAGAWMGQVYGGISYVGSFSNAMPNVSYVFSKNLGNGNARYTADATSHEAGHAFGLTHQSSYSGASMTQVYSTGPGNGTAPIMGNSYYAGRSLWWNGTSDVSSSTYQDDMSIIAGAANGFGYRPESAGTTVDTATMINRSGDQVSASGVILTGQDANYYTVLAGAGDAAFTIQAASGHNNLIPTLQLYDATGTVLLASATAPADGSPATITYTFGAAGGYRLVVRGDGTYGNAGQYSLTGTVGLPPNSLYIDAPSNLTASANSSQIAISWAEASANESGFRILRSTNGVDWSTIASNLPANTTSFVDSSVNAGVTYAYRVVAFNLYMTSNASNTATAAIPVVVTAPPASASGLGIASRSGNAVTLAWNDNANNESGYRIQRSVNGGKTWSTIAVVSANTTSYVDRAVKGSKRYIYRVVAFNSKGNAAQSNTAGVTTPKFSATRQARQFKLGGAAKIAPLQAKKAAAANTPPAGSVSVILPAASVTLSSKLPAQAAEPRAFHVDWTPLIG